jgi:TatD DNase family protein
MKLIDTHCHLYLGEFSEDISNVIERAKSHGIQRFYLPGIDSSVIDAMLALANAYPGECIPMMGLHPCSVKANYLEELELVKFFLKKIKNIAIGEIGLDFYWDKTFEKEQYDAFNVQMELALLLGLPIVIHTRNAMQETINTVKPFAKKGLKGIFHCFSGSYESAKQITDMGFYLGIGGVITYKNAGLPAALEQISLDWMVLETDAPYLTPVPYRGKRNESSYLTFIAQKLAEAKKVSIEEVAAVTTANAEKIFGC